MVVTVDGSNSQLEHRQKIAARLGWRRARNGRCRRIALASQLVEELFDCGLVGWSVLDDKDAVELLHGAPLTTMIAPPVWVDHLLNQLRELRHGLRYGFSSVWLFIGAKRID